MEQAKQIFDFVPKPVDGTWWVVSKLVWLVVWRIEGEDAARLEEAFFVKEVVFALSNLSRDKALGSDGYPLAF